MLCEKCGTQNESGARLCADCGAPMPPRSAGGGFADILSYKPVVPPTPTSVPSAGTDPAAQRRLQALEKRVADARNMALITIIAAACALIFAVVGLILCLQSDGDKEEHHELASEEQWNDVLPDVFEEEDDTSGFEDYIKPSKVAQDAEPSEEQEIVGQESQDTPANTENLQNPLSTEEPTQTESTSEPDTTAPPEKTTEPASSEESSEETSEEDPTENTTGEVPTDPAPAEDPTEPTGEKEQIEPIEPIEPNGEDDGSDDSGNSDSETNTIDTPNGV